MDEQLGWVLVVVGSTRHRRQRQSTKYPNIEYQVLKYSGQFARVHLRPSYSRFSDTCVGVMGDIFETTSIIYHRRIGKNEGMKSCFFLSTMPQTKNKTNAQGR